MHDSVAVEVETSTGAVAYLLSFGRILDRVTLAPLERPVKRAAEQVAFPGAPVSGRVCDSLHEAR
jgi:hypothetical protein